MALAQGAIDILPALPYIPNSYSTEKKEKDHYHPPGVCRRQLKTYNSVLPV